MKNVAKKCSTVPYRIDEFRRCWARRLARSKWSVEFEWKTRHIADVEIRLVRPDRPIVIRILATDLADCLVVVSERISFLAYQGHQIQWPQKALPAYLPGIRVVTKLCGKTLEEMCKMQTRNECENARDINQRFIYCYTSSYSPLKELRCIVSAIKNKSWCIN